MDISADALREASACVSAAGFDGRFIFIEADVRRLAPDERFAEVELLTCFMMGPRLLAEGALRGLVAPAAGGVPNARRLLLGDTARTRGIADKD